LIFEFASCDLHDQHSVADYIGETLLAFGVSGHYVIPSTATDIDRQLRKPIMATWVKCTDENGQTIYANLDNAITRSAMTFGIEARSSRLWEVQTVPSW